MDKKVLVAVLDWGLGHATRMVPVIDVLAKSGLNIIITSSGRSLEYLQDRYPMLEALEMPSKKVAYSRYGAGWALAKRVIQQPGLNKIQERWTRELVKKHGLNGIISDNVYGAVSNQVPSVIVTHQVGLMAPVFKSAFDKKLAAWLDRFAEVWIPDLPGTDSLAGEMTENVFVSTRQRYIGRLSRLEELPAQNKAYDILALVSGPEPQRTAMENIALEYFEKRSGKKLLIRGSSDLPGLDVDGKNVEIKDFLDGVQLSETIQRSKMVICRSGFSTLCDLMALHARAELIPTPQQPEQVYLAKRCRDKGWFATLTTQGGNSEAVCKPFPPNESVLLEEAVQHFISLL
jgi:predicted glycosyltransferase